MSNLDAREDKKDIEAKKKKSLSRNNGPKLLKFGERRTFHIFQKLNKSQIDKFREKPC